MVFDCHTPRFPIADQTMPLSLAGLTKKGSKGYSCSSYGHMAVDLQVMAKCVVNHTERHYCSLHMLAR